MAKYDARDLLDITRLFEHADQNDVPRLIERIETFQPTPHTSGYRFRFKKSGWYVLQDNSLEDDEAEIIQLLKTHTPDIFGELIQNPHADFTTYAMPFKGKDVYLFKELSRTTRLDIVLSERHPEVSRSTWQKLIKKGEVAVNGVVITKSNYDVAPNDAIEARPPQVPNFSTLHLPILYEDSDVIVVDKPAGILTHAKGALSEEFTVGEFLRSRTKVAAGTNRPGIIHRLDRDTSGVIIGAKNEAAAKLLKKQFSDRTVKKTYLALLAGHPELSRGLIDVPIARNPSAPSTFRADPMGKSAQTYFEVLAVNEAKKITLTKFQPRTGRTHQIRIHAAYLKTPILGDRVYGRSDTRLFLHAYELELTLPGGKRTTFRSSLPNEFTNTLGQDIQL